MNDWNPDKYLVYRNERTQPAIDLAERIVIDNPKNIIDIGCGPGNSTQILLNKWQNSNVVGLDVSKTMIEKAKADYPEQTWIQGDAQNIATDKKYSIVFSNAALQWMENHEKLIPRLWELVDDNGVFAAQIPNFETMPVNVAINNVLNKWKFIKSNFWNKDLHYYYELLSPYAKEIFLWETHYFHILPSLQAIVDFIHSSALKPYLGQLNTEAEKQEFEKDILEECKKYYKEQTNGNVLFPFQRMFIIAYKK